MRHGRIVDGCFGDDSGPFDELRPIMMRVPSG
jgi:hypothetical protein